MDSYRNKGTRYSSVLFLDEKATPILCSRRDETLMVILLYQKPRLVWRRLMAAVDSFELLFKELSKYFSNIRDAFAVIGAYYVAKKSLNIVSHVAGAAYVHIYSYMAQEVDLRQKYGPWAGKN